MATWSPSNVLITKQGDELLANIQAGLIDSLEITEVRVGSGRESTSALYTMGNLTFARQNAEIIAKKASSTGSTLELQVSNEGLTEAYNIAQIGVFAKYNDTTILYMIAQCDEGTEDYMPLPTLTPTTMSYSFNVIQGSATELIVQVNPAGFVTYEQFAQAEEIVKSGTEISPEYEEVVEEDLEDETNFSLSSGETLPTLVRKLAVVALKILSHSKNKSNPHSVTATQVGLGKVPNVATNDQTPTYTESSSLTNLVSGEKLSVAFGKVKKAITDLMAHLSNKSNPHSVTYTQTGAAATKHEHEDYLKSIATYYPISTEMNADDLADPLALIPTTSEVNSELYNIIGSNWTYVLSLFYGTRTNTSRRVQLAFNYSSSESRMAMRHYMATGWTPWKSITNDMRNPLPVTAGGTGAITASDALKNLGAADSSHEHSISEVQGLSNSLNGKAESSHEHSISDVSGLQSSLDGKAPTSHNHSASQITSGTLPITRGGTGATSASDALSKLGAQPNLGFTPVQQGGGSGQKDNKIYIGWTDSYLKAQVDNVDLGNILTDGSSNPAVLPISKGGTGAKTAANAESAIMPITTIITASTFGSKRDAVGSVSSCYIKKIGKRINGTLNLSNVSSSANCKAQVFTIASAYRPTGTHRGMVNVMTLAENGNFSRAMGFINVSENDGIITLILPTSGVTYPTVEVFFDYYIG